MRLPAARQISHEPLTFASMTACQSSTLWSTIGATRFVPEAATSRSTVPYAPTAPSTIASAPASLSGRCATSSASIPFRGQLVAELGQALAVAAGERQARPAAPSARAAAPPNVPVAPVMSAERPETSNSDSTGLGVRVAVGLELGVPAWSALRRRVVGVAVRGDGDGPRLRPETGRVK